MPTGRKGCEQGSFTRAGLKTRELGSTGKQLLVRGLGGAENSRRKFVKLNFRVWSLKSLLWLERDQRSKRGRGGVGSRSTGGWWVRNPMRGRRNRWWCATMTHLHFRAVQGGMGERGSSYLRTQNIQLINSNMEFIRQRSAWLCHQP